MKETTIKRCKQPHLDAPGTAFGSVNQQAAKTGMGRRFVLGPTLTFEENHTCIAWSSRASDPQHQRLIISGCALPIYCWSFRGCDWGKLRPLDSCHQSYPTRPRSFPPMIFQYTAIMPPGVRPKEPLHPVRKIRPCTCISALDARRPLRELLGSYLFPRWMYPT